MQYQHHDGANPGLLTPGFVPGRRRFLGGLAAASAGLLLGAPGLVGAASAADSGTQQKVLELLRRMRNEGLLAGDERTSWSVYDLTAGRTLVAVNDELPRQTASMIKPLIAQAYFFQVQKSGGRVPYTEGIRATMVRSIRHSSNPATNEMIDLVSAHASGRGAQDVEAVLRSQAPNIFQHTRVVEKIPANGRTFRNRASAGDYSRFLTALWQDRLPYSRELKSIMGLANRDRITHGVDAIHGTVQVYDKTGSTSQCCGNMGLIVASSYSGRQVPYTFVGIIERATSTRSYGTWIKHRGNIIRAVSNLVYLDMKDRYQLV